MFSNKIKRKNKSIIQDNCNLNTNLVIELAKKQIKDPNFTEKMMKNIEEQELHRDLITGNSRPEADDFGYDLNNPVYTSSINQSDKYLSKLTTISNEKIQWFRIGSVTMKECNGVEDVIVDIYQLYINGKQFRKLYICPYGKNSDSVPKGLSITDQCNDIYGGNLQRESKDKGIDLEDLIKIINVSYENKNIKENRNKNIGLESDRIEIANILCCDLNNLSCVQNLAISTINTINSLAKEGSISYICNSNICCCDTAIFSLFIIRAFCLGMAGNLERAKKFSDDYINIIKKLAEYTYIKDNSKFTQMFDNRISYYEKVFASRDTIHEKIAAMLEAYEFVIKTDLVNEVYTSISVLSAQPILGIVDDIKCHNEIQEYFQQLPIYLYPYYDEVRDYLL